MNKIYQIADYVYNNYPDIKTKFPFWKILSLLDKNEDKVAFVEENHTLLGAAFFLRLTDDSLVKIINDELKVSDVIDMRKLLDEKGDNIHFIYVVADSMRTVLKGLKMVIEKEKPHSISWFKPDMSLHFIRLRGELCLQ